MLIVPQRHEVHKEIFLMALVTLWEDKNYPTTFPQFFSGRHQVYKGFFFVSFAPSVGEIH